MYGNDVLDLVAHLDERDKTLIVIRHSERPSFDNLPISRWDSLGITSQGVEAAQDFGMALAQELRAADLRVYGWGLQRCIDTAGAIATGAKRGGCRVVDQRTLRLKSPIADRRGYEAAQLSDNWQETVRGWLSGSLETPMVPIEKYGPEILGNLFDPGVCASGETSLVVTHDLQIMAIASHLFGSPVGWPTFLDGLVLKSDDKEVLVGMGEMVRSVPLDQTLK